MHFKSLLLTRETKVIMYQTLGRLVLMCGSETWALTRSHQLRLCTSERKILRKINGPVQEKGEWSTRRGQERTVPSLAVTLQMLQGCDVQGTCEVTNNEIPRGNLDSKLG
jgi:hypothetical protein